MALKHYAWIIGFYTAWVVAHYVASNAYVKYCTPNTLQGFIMSPFVAMTPHCEGLRWVITKGGTNITTMWSIAGIWLTSTLAALC